MLIFLGWLFVLQLFAETQMGEILDLAAEYRQKSQQVSLTEEKKRQMMAEVYGLEKETQKILYRKTDLDERKAKLDHDLNEASQEILVLEEKLRILIPDLLQTLKLAERLDQMPWLFTMVTSQSALEVEEMQEITKGIADDHAARLVEFAQTRSSLEQERVRLSQTARQILTLKKEMAQQERRVTALEKQKKNMLKEMERFLTQERQSLERLHAQGKKLSQNQDLQDLEILFDRGFFDKKGKLPIPTQGTLRQGFGLNKALSFDRVQLLHKGHFYQTVRGEKAIAVAEARVAHIGNVPGYGQVVVLDHGNHYYTTYANLKEVLTKAGQELKTGQMIGRTGHSHLQMGVGLYFEIRHFSQPQDPSDWLLSPSSELASLQQ